MQREMNLFQTVVMVTKNVAGLTVMAGIGIFRKHYVKVVCFTAIVSSIYLVL